MSIGMEGGANGRERKREGRKEKWDSAGSGGCCGGLGERSEGRYGDMCVEGNGEGRLAEGGGGGGRGTCRGKMVGEQGRVGAIWGCLGNFKT